MSDYPEHDKMAALRPQIDAVTAFLEWCEERHILLVDTSQGDELAAAEDLDEWGQVPIANLPFQGIRELLAAHFSIDEQRISEEKDAMLRELRNLS